MNKKYLYSFLVASLFLLQDANANMSDIETAVMNKDFASVNAMTSKILRNTSDPKERLQAQYYRGLSELRLGRYAQSRKSFSMVMQANSSAELYDKAAVGMIESLHMAGFYKDVLTESEHFLKHNPNSSYLSLVYFKMARANLKLMRWQKANELLDKVIQDFPQSMEAPLARQLKEEKQYFAVQVGAFEDKKRAFDLSNELKESSQYAYLVETTTPEGNKIYRVRVGQLTSLDKAKELEKNLTKLGYPTLIYP